MTVVILPSIQYSILNQRDLLNVNILNILSICTLTFPLKPNMNGSGLQSIQYSIVIQRALLNVNIVNIHCICTLLFKLKLRYHP
jgi:hypothetical protein